MLMTGPGPVHFIIPARAVSALHMCTDVNFLFVEIDVFSTSVEALLPAPPGGQALGAASLEFAGHLPLSWASKHLRWPAPVLWAWEGQPGVCLCAQDLWLPGVLLFAWKLLFSSREGGRYGGVFRNISVG